MPLPLKPNKSEGGQELVHAAVVALQAELSAVKTQVSAARTQVGRIRMQTFLVTAVLLYAGDIGDPDQAWIVTWMVIVATLILYFA